MFRFWARNQLLLAVFMGWCVLFTGCDRGAKPGAAKSAPPSKVATPVKEDQLNTIELTPQAEQRLGIQFAAVEKKPVRQIRTYGGEVALPTGASVIVSAPVSGTLQPPAKSKMPKVGDVLAERQPVLLLLPMLSPERAVLTPSERLRMAEARNTVATSRIDAAGQVDQAGVQVEAAKVALERAQRLLKEQAGTVRTVDEAQAQMSLALKSQAAAQARKKQLDSLELDQEAAGILEPLLIESPHAGIVRVTHALPGEVVAAGAPLFEVMNPDPMWIRVAVYAGELSEIAVDLPAQVGSLTSKAGDKWLSAKPASAPPTATPLSSTVDLYYELANPKGYWRPGQKVNVQLTVAGPAEAPCLPWSAVVHDIQGGCWVYESTAPHTFVRRRVEIRNVFNDLAVLENGPAVGTKVAIEGVAELFGTEFGFGK
ncbi:MAG: macrolide transporter subunit MacA [Planctomycetaceae bacterium]|nr:macrolide transporter subunit MacA [Planctomycetaceae bacterium]